MASRSGALSLVRARFAATLLELSGRGFGVPAFKGELEARIQADVLRLAGRFRQGLRWKDDRVKIPLAAIVHARADGPRVQLWLRPQGAPAQAVPQRMSLGLCSADTALDFVRHLPGATPPPPALSDIAAPGHAYLTWGAIIGALSVMLLVGLVLALRRAF